MITSAGNSLDFLFEAKMLLFLVAGILLFRCYQKLFSKNLTTLDNLPGGFIKFVALNGTLAVPFILFHLSFNSYLKLYVLINIVIIALAIKKDVAKIRRHKISKSNLKNISLYGAIAAISILACGALTQTIVKYDADDSFYVGLIKNSVGNDHLYSYDPSTGDKNYPLSKSYAIESWELIESASSKLLNLEPAAFAHSLVPLFIVSLAFLTYRLIFYELLKDKNNTNLALTALSIFFIFGGYSLYSQGTFLLSRSWQGKAVIATLVIPFLIFIFINIWNNPKSKSNYIALLITNMATVYFNPIGVYISLFTLLGFGAIIIFKARRLTPILGLMSASIPIIAAGTVMYVLNRVSSKNLETAHLAAASGKSLTYFDYFKKFIGNSYYFQLYIIGAIVTFKGLSPKQKSVMVYFPAILLASLMNPIAYRFVNSNITYTTYWRLFWLIPITISLPIVLVQARQHILDRFKEHSNILDPVAAVAFCAILVISGSFVFQKSNPLVAIDMSPSKLPAGVYDTSKAMDHLTSKTVLASRDVAAYLHNITDKHRLLISRSLYISQQYAQGSSQYSDITNLFAMINGPIDNNTAKTYAPLLGAYNVGYTIIQNINLPASGEIPEFGQVVYRNNSYTVIER